MTVPFVSFRPLEAELNAPLRAAFDRVLQNSWYIEGQEDAAFERAFAVGRGKVGNVARRNLFGFFHCG